MAVHRANIRGSKDEMLPRMGIKVVLQAIWGGVRNFGGNLRSELVRTSEG
jgi:hypothetical protein